MIERVTYGPIDTWPGRLLNDGDREWSPFSAGYAKTERLLEREADMLDASTCVVRLALRSSAFYKDGSGITANASLPTHPGVIVALDGTVHGTLTFSCDRYRRRGYTGEADSWMHNVRAIALGLEALRQAERYGIADRGQQYAGFAALGSGVPMGAKREPMTVDDAATLLAGAIVGTRAESVLTNRTIAAACHRAAMRLLHPDHGAADDETTRDKLARLHEAWSIIGAHHREIA